MERLTLEKAIFNEKEEMVKNKRASNFISIDSIDDNIKMNYRKSANEHERLAKWLEELKRCKDLEEQGLLLKLPVPLETMVYCIYTSITGNNSTIFSNRFNAEMCNVWGISVFATKEEADKRLKELKWTKQIKILRIIKGQR